MAVARDRDESSTEPWLSFTVFSHSRFLAESHCWDRTEAFFPFSRWLLLLRCSPGVQPLPPTYRSPHPLPSPLPPSPVAPPQHCPRESVSPPVAAALASTRGARGRGSVEASFCWAPSRGDAGWSNGTVALRSKCTSGDPESNRKHEGESRPDFFCSRVSFQQQKQRRLHLVILSLLSSLTLRGCFWLDVASARQPRDAVWACSNPGACASLKLPCSFFFSFFFN